MSVTEIAIQIVSHLCPGIESKKKDVEDEVEEFLVDFPDSGDFNDLCARIKKISPITGTSIDLHIVNSYLSQLLDQHNLDDYPDSD
jgi:hypothetical protein